MNSKKKAGKKRRNGIYTQGELNSLVDSTVHPLYKSNEGFRLLDGVLHGVIERNPPLSVKKFIRYSLPQIVKKVAESL